MKKDILEIIEDKMDESKKEGYEGVEIPLFMRAYDIKKDVLDYLRKDNDVIYADDDKGIPTLYISWEDGINYE